MVDSRARQLWRGGQAAHLSTKAFDLLVLLVSRRPDAVSKEEIRGHLWGDIHVSENNLPTLVAEIRDALGDDASQMRYVRTVHRFGYAFQHAGAETPDASPSIAAAWLIGTSGRFRLSTGENVLGRDDATLALESPTISRRHARITIEPESAMVEDLGSKNGTYVNQVRVAQATRVVDGDVLRVGDLVFTFRPARAVRSTETM